MHHKLWDHFIFLLNTTIFGLLPRTLILASTQHTEDHVFLQIKTCFSSCVWAAKTTQLVCFVPALKIKTDRQSECLRWRSDIYTGITDARFSAWIIYLTVKCRTERFTWAPSRIIAASSVRVLCWNERRPKSLRLQGNWNHFLLRKFNAERYHFVPCLVCNNQGLFCQKQRDSNFRQAAELFEIQCFCLQMIEITKQNWI